MTIIIAAIVWATFASVALQKFALWAAKNSPAFAAKQQRIQIGLANTAGMSAETAHAQLISHQDA